MMLNVDDQRSKAYALSSAMLLATIKFPEPLDSFEKKCNEVIYLAKCTDDVYLKYFSHFVVGWGELHRGRADRSLDTAEELISSGRKLNDARPLGLGNALKAWVALASDDSIAALKFSEICLDLARAPIEFVNAKTVGLCAKILLKRKEAFDLLREWMERCEAEGWQDQLNGLEGIWGVALVIHGDIGRGLLWLEQAIHRREQSGYRAAADWYRLLSAEVYIEVIASKEKPPALVIMRNALRLVVINFSAQKRIRLLIDQVRQNPQFDPNGVYVGRCEMILGLLYKAKKKRALALQHLTEAKRIAAQFGPTPMLAKIEAAFAELA